MVYIPFLMVHSHYSLQLPETAIKPNHSQEARHSTILDEVQSRRQTNQISLGYEYRLHTGASTAPGSQKCTGKEAEAPYAQAPDSSVPQGSWAPCWREETEESSNRGKQKHAWGGIQVLGNWLRRQRLRSVKAVERKKRSWWATERASSTDHSTEICLLRFWTTLLICHYPFPIAHLNHPYCNLGQWLVLLLATRCCVLSHLLRLYRAIIRSHLCKDLNVQQKNGL